MINKKQDTEILRERIPPQAVEIEMAVLGSVMLDKESIYRTMELLPDGKFFYKTAHERMYDAMLALNQKDQVIDLITMTEELKKAGKLDEIGGSYYLTECINQVTSAANVEYHAKIVLEKALLRGLITVANNISEESYDANEDALTLLDKAEQRIFSLSQNRLKQGFEEIDSIMRDAVGIIDDYQQRKGSVIGVATGFTKIDEMTAGFQNSDLVIIAGRPSMGKTALALSIALHACIEHNTGVGFFSLEMSKFQLATRLLSLNSKVELNRLRTGKMKKEDYTKVVIAAGNIAEIPMFIDDSASLSVFEMRAKARRLKNEKNVGMIIVDYLQLVTGSTNSENRQQEISMISRSLKALAKELDLPVVALSQLSRAPETRSGSRRPMLSDLRESGAIEQDADVVMFIYRPEFYGETEDEDGNSTENIADVIIGKQRNGPTGTIKLTFIKESARFENYAYGEEFV